MSEGIAYQNKDITSKLFAERFKGKALKIYGLNVPKVKQELPTNIPAIQANELRIDNVFLLADDTVAIIDYESDYDKWDKHKYIRYVNHIIERYSNEWKRDVKVRMIVIYTADVEAHQTSDVLDGGCLKFKVETAYLASVDSSKVLSRLQSKVSQGLPLSEEELMEFIILPLTYRGNQKKNEAIKRAINMVEQIPDEDTRIFLLTGIAVFSDKIIEKEYSDKIRRKISMTKVGQLFEEEKIKYAEEQKLCMLITMVNAGRTTEEDAAITLNCDVEEFRRMRDAKICQPLYNESNVCN